VIKFQEKVRFPVSVVRLWEIIDAIHCACGCKMCARCLVLGVNILRDWRDQTSYVAEKPGALAQSLSRHLAPEGSAIFAA
jgi:hypothetical protein